MPKFLHGIWTAVSASIDQSIPSALYCIENYKGAITDAIDYVGDPLATQLGLQVDQDISGQDYVNNQSVWGVIKGNNIVSHDGNIIVGVAAAGATAGLGAGPGILAAEATGAIPTSSLLGYALTSRGGVAATTGLVNLGAQLIHTNGSFSDVNYINLGASVLGFLWRNDMNIQSPSIIMAIQIAIEGGNAVEEISQGWTKARQVVFMKEGISAAVRQRIGHEVPTLRYWVSLRTPHNPATEGFMSDEDGLGSLFPVVEQHCSK